MYERFLNFINSESLIDRSGKILLGISGGVDSMVMFNLFLESGYPIAAAHCNFNLRGKESDQDQLFVAAECRKNNIHLHAKKFDTVNYSKERGMSLQMAARDLRYAWFNHLIAEYNYRNIAIAHNKNDLAETMLINIIRGTGIRGLTGIKAKTGNIIRPLLFAERKEIIRYAGKHEISFREDSSNINIKYKRNRIRHKIIPEFEAISDSFVKSLYQTACRLKDVETVYTDTINRKFDEICTESNNECRLNINSLLSLNPLPSYLYEFLRKWNFSRELVSDIIVSLKSPPGKQFYSPTHRLVKDRESLIIIPLKPETVNRYYIEEDTTELHYPLKLKISKANMFRGFGIPGNPEVACLDLNLLHFPLILRKWQKGDYFQPLGMNGLKKLSDFFVDNKFSLIEKERTWLLASGNKVVWIIGHRIDDRFKITERTKDILIIEIAD